VDVAGSMVCSRGIRHGRILVFPLKYSYAGTLGSALGAIAFAILAIYLHHPSDKFAVYAFLPRAR
jgi:hypothetical protein